MHMYNLMLSGGSSNKLEVEKGGQKWYKYSVNVRNSQKN